MACKYCHGNIVSDDIDGQDGARIVIEEGLEPIQGTFVNTPMELRIRNVSVSDGHAWGEIGVYLDIDVEQGPVSISYGSEYDGQKIIYEMPKFNIDDCYDFEIRYCPKCGEDLSKNRL